MWLSHYGNGGHVRRQTLANAAVVPITSVAQCTWELVANLMAQNSNQNSPHLVLRSLQLFFLWPPAVMKAIDRERR